jgi:hypothetical protein
MAAALDRIAREISVTRVAEHKAEQISDLKPVKGHEPRDLTSGASDPAPHSAQSRGKPIVAESSSQPSYQVRAIKIARGLVARADLNGKRCVIIGSFSEASGRWPVRFLDSGEETLIKDINIVGDDVEDSESSDNDHTGVWHAADDEKRAARRPILFADGSDDNPFGATIDQLFAWA